MPPTTRAMTVRLDEDQAARLELVASIDNVPVAVVVREAIANHIDHRQDDEQFRTSLRDRIEQAQRMLR